MSFIANEELERAVQAKYREAMEAELASLERRSREHALRLESRLADSEAEAARLRAELKAAASALPPSRSTSDGSGNSGSGSGDGREAAALRAEAARLDAALTASEEALKATEEEAWKAKAEAAEMMFALKLEEDKSTKAAARAEQVGKELRAALERVGELEAAGAAARESEPEPEPKSSSTEPAPAPDAALLDSLQQQVQSLSGLNAALQQEIAACKDELAAAEKGSAEALKKTEAAKAAQIKSDKEVAQLQVVIKQLQQKQKGSRDDIGAVTAERDALRQQVAELQGEAQELEKMSSQASKADALSSELEGVKRQRDRAEAALDDAKRRVGELEKANYDLGEAQQAGRSDSLLLQQEIDQRRLETENLRDALQQLKREHAAWKSRNQDEVERRMDALRKEHEAGLLEAEAAWRLKLGELEEAVRLGQQREQDEALLRRKAEIDLNVEKRKLKKTLDDALLQLRNSQEDVVDRTLIANLVVAYFARGRPLDGLQLLSRVLGFTEEQEEVVGLRVPNINLIGTLYTTIVGAPPKPVSVEGENLLEMWANFLEMEAQESLTGRGGAARGAPSATAAAAAPMAPPATLIPTPPTPTHALPTHALPRPPPMPRPPSSASKD